MAGWLDLVEMEGHQHGHVETNFLVGRSSDWGLMILEENCPAFLLGCLYFAETKMFLAWFSSELLKGICVTFYHGRSPFGDETFSSYF